MPACDAVTEHVPAVTGVRVTPLTVQIVVVVEANVTVKPEAAVAVSVKAEAGTVPAPGVAKVMVLTPFAIVKLCPTEFAGV